MIGLPKSIDSNQFDDRVVLSCGSIFDMHDVKEIPEPSYETISILRKDMASR